MSCSPFPLKCSSHRGIPLCERPSALRPSCPHFQLPSARGSSSKINQQTKAQGNRSGRFDQRICPFSGTTWLPIQTEPFGAEMFTGEKLGEPCFTCLGERDVSANLVSSLKRNAMTEVLYLGISCLFYGFAPATTHAA